MNKIITSQEINCLRFYQGDISHYIINNIEEYNKYNSQFYQTKGAYHILNMLLYPGIENEKVRICHENKKVPLYLLNNIEELLVVYKNIFNLMCKYSCSNEKHGIIHAFRKDRVQSMEMFNNDYLYAITSCSLKDESEDYFLKKNGILLLEFDIPTSVPFVILNDVLGVNLFQYQEELLLPPFLSFSKFKLDLTQKEWEYRDINNAHPKAKYLLKITNYMSKLKKYDKLNKEYDLYNLSKETKYIISVLERLVEGYDIQKKEIMEYCSCKAEIQKFVQEMFLKIYKSFFE